MEKGIHFHIRKVHPGDTIFMAHICRCNTCRVYIENEVERVLAKLDQSDESTDEYLDDADPSEEDPEPESPTQKLSSSSTLTKRHTPLLCRGRPLRLDSTD